MSQEEQPEINIDRLETWMLRFCFGKKGMEWNEPSGCGYANETSICALYEEEKDNNPPDYCPLSQFVDWLKEQE